MLTGGETHNPSDESSDKPKKKEHFWWSYISAMRDLGISRRTLQRWLDDLNIDSLEFEDHLRVFLTLPHIQKLRNYKVVMKTRSQSIITRYRAAYETGNERRMNSILKEAVRIQSEKDVRIQSERKVPR